MCVKRMWCILSKTFICLIIFFGKSKEFATAAKSSPMEGTTDYDALVTSALFQKINLMLVELKNISHHFNDFKKRQHNQNQIIRYSIDGFKSEIQQSLNQHQVSAESLVAGIKQEIASRFDGQKQLLENSALSVDNMNLSEERKFKQNRNWQTILRRQDGSLDFNRSWNEYKWGFGSSNANYFIGLESLHAITTYSDPQELLIVLQDFANNTRYAKYADFVVGSENEKYKIIKLGNYQGDAGDSFTQHYNFKFSTYDQDNDNTTMTHCAKRYQGGWWFSNCFSSHLTGVYLYEPNIGNEKDKGLIWYSWHGLQMSLKYVEMKIRPK